VSTPTIIGIDNGPTGSIGVIRHRLAVYFGPVPTKPSLHYGKKGSISNRLDRATFNVTLMKALDFNGQSWPGTDNIRVFIERPFTASAMMIKAMMSSARFFEATIIALEDLGLGYEVIDSGTWQKPLLGAVKGSKELKLASKLRGQQLYPQYADAIKEQGDADGLLIAHHFARNQ